MLAQCAEVVEYASGLARDMMGELVENVATGLDTYSIRQPLGVSDQLPTAVQPCAGPNACHAHSRTWRACQAYQIELPIICHLAVAMIDLEGLLPSYFGDCIVL